jgi:hypothetical protein
MPNYSAALTASIDTASFPFCESRTEFLRAEDKVERPTRYRPWTEREGTGTKNKFDARPQCCEQASDDEVSLGRTKDDDGLTFFQEQSFYQFNGLRGLYRRYFPAQC